MARDGARHPPTPWRGPKEAAGDETSLPDAARLRNLAVKARARPVQPARGNGELAGDDRPPGELGAPCTGRPSRPKGMPGGKDAVYRHPYPEGSIAIPAVQVVREVVDGVQLRRRRHTRDGPRYRATCRTVRWASELASGCLVLGATGGVPAVKPAAKTATATATS